MGKASLGGSAIKAVLPALGPFGAIAGALPDILGGLGGLFGFGQSQEQLQDQVDFNQDQSQSNPFNVGGASGAFNFSGQQGSASEGQGANLFRQLMMQQAPGLFSGGQFQNQQFQNAFQNNNIGGALDFSNQLNSQQMNADPFSVMGQANNMFNLGAGNLQQAGNTSGLVQQNLDASRALAQPFENQLVNRFDNNEFMRTRGATSGANERQSNMIDSLLRNDSNRVLGAQQLGQADQQFLGNLGMAQTQQGFQGFGQSFNQGSQALRGNQTAGNQRLGNAMNLFGQGNQTFLDSINAGMGLQGGNLAQDQTLNDMMVQLLNADNNRIDAQSGFAGANAELAGTMSSGSKGFFDSVLGGFGF